MSTTTCYSNNLYDWKLDIYVSMLIGANSFFEFSCFLYRFEIFTS
jgi:hypothetical protein